MYEGNGAIVAIAHTNEKHLSQERVLGLVAEAMEHIGGMRAFIRSGDSVLIKPNQTVFYTSDEGCTTSPLVVGALIRLSWAAGASRVQVGESSGGFFSSLECMQITGMAAVAEREGAELVDLGSDEVPNKVVEVLNGEVIDRVPLPIPLIDADVIIDVPKAKNHHIEPISGALKNWVGVVNQNWRNRNHGDVDMIKRFVDIMTVSKPTLCVTDALIVGEGDGPIANQPRWCGCILASTDPVATDVTIAKLLGHDWKQLQFAKEAEERGLGMRQPIEYLGRQVEDVAVNAWPGHQGFDYLPVNFIVGTDVNLAGTIGHVKSVVDSMLRRGELGQVIWLKGTPTFMIGEADDPNFEVHLKEGPYIVFDDSAKPEYKNDPRVHFVPGHPVLQTAMPNVMEGLGVKYPGQALMKWQQFERWGMSNVEYGTPLRKALTIAKPFAAAGMVIAGVWGAARLARKLLGGGEGSERR